MKVAAFICHPGKCLSMFEETGRDFSEEQCFKVQVQTNVPRATRKQQAIFPLVCILSNIIREQKRWKKPKKVFLAPADTRKLQGGYAGTCMSRTLCKPAGHDQRCQSQVRKAGRSKERTERIANVVTPDADAKEDLLRVPVLLLCHRHKSCLRISGDTHLGASCFAKHK